MLSLLWRHKPGCFLPGEKLLHTPDWRGEGMRNNLFAFHVCLWCASFVPCLLLLGKKDCFQFPGVRQPPQWHLPFLSPLAFPLIPRVELAFSVRGMDGSLHCWITALIQRTLHPSDNKKADSFVWMEVNSWEQMMLAGVIYVATSTVVTGFCCDRDKQTKGGGGRVKFKDRMIYVKKKNIGKWFGCLFLWVLCSTL